MLTSITLRVNLANVHIMCQKFKLVPISTSTCKIWWRLDDPRPSYCVFSIFNMAAFRHLGFSYYRNVCQKFKFNTFKYSESAAVSVHQCSGRLHSKHVPEWSSISGSQLGSRVVCLEVKNPKE